eukprot:265913_1
MHFEDMQVRLRPDLIEISIESDTGRPSPQEIVIEMQRMEKMIEEMCALQQKRIPRGTAGTRQDDAKPEEHSQHTEADALPQNLDTLWVEFTSWKEDVTRNHDAVMRNHEAVMRNQEELMKMLSTIEETSALTQTAEVNTNDKVKGED